ncbi:MAG: UDP-N-acetylglucosamine 2-epimerase (hydrolyzing) [Rhodobacterales bacterium]|nr:MAG: UDP-N-acetylglucosamine 2-epimerase (hydrolyzing) [Rhodobacterales bacterium]
MAQAQARQILFVTGTRADFGKLEPLALAARDAGFRVSFFVTGMHMMERYGLTKIEVHRLQGVEVFEFENQAEDDPQDMILARTITGFSAFVADHQPDLVVVHGDRVEALAAALVCATNYLRCAHIEGGEVSGTIDEIFRHCNTKLSTYHFVSSEVAKSRVQALGEVADSIYVTGSPELDTHRAASGVSMEQVRQHYDIDFDDYGIVTFHPVTSEQDSIGAQARALFDRLVASGRHFVVILPNNDPGANDIVQVINTLPNDRFRVLPSMRFAYFSELLKNAAAHIGNSSVGVREAPFLGLPSLDIGTRQNKRSNAGSISHCSAHDGQAIDDFLAQKWGKRHDSDSGFGAGSSAQLFVDILKDQKFWQHPLQKEFQDLG